MWVLNIANPGEDARQTAAAGGVRFQSLRPPEKYWPVAVRGKIPMET
jgi:hypothetical protein